MSFIFFILKVAFLFPVVHLVLTVNGLWYVWVGLIAWVVVVQIEALVMSKK